MIVIIACTIAVISTAALLLLWFGIAFNKLSHSKHEMTSAAVQAQMHRTLYNQERGNPNAQAAKRMLETSNMIYRETIKSYNRVLANPIYRIPGFIMGFQFYHIDYQKE